MYSYKRTPLSVEVNKVLKMLMVTLFSMLLVLSFLFFAHMSGNAEKGSVVLENQQKQKSLESENRLLKEQVLEAQSIENINISEEIEDMAPSDNEEYVRPLVPISRDTRNDAKQLVY